MDEAGAGGRSMLDAVLAAVAAARRSGSVVSIPQHGVTVEWDHGAVAQCERCGISWRVSRSCYRTAAWWTCPRGCGRG